MKIGDVPGNKDILFDRRNQIFSIFRKNLETSFRILSGSAKTALPRQRTLQATIDWSHDLLTDAERSVFRRAAMFAEGFDLEAAEAVCVGDDVAEWEIVDLVHSLVDKSLLIVVHGAHSRFRMLEPIRQYAQEQLQRSGDSAEVLEAHAAHYRRFIASAAVHTRGPDQMDWDRRLDADLENLRTALRTLLESGDVTGFLAMAFDLYQYWMHVSLHGFDMEALHAGIAAAGDDVDPELIIKAYFVIGVLGAEITDPKAVAPAREGLRLAEEIGDDALAARAHLAAGAAIVHSRGGPSGHEHMLLGQAMLDENPGTRWWEPEWEEAHLRFLLSAYLPAEEPRKRQHADFAIEAFERLGDRAMLAASLIETFTIARGSLDYALSAVENIRQALEICDEIHLPYWAGHAHKHLGWTLMQLEDWEEAATQFQASLEPLEDSGDVSCWINASGFLARAELALGRTEMACDRVLKVLLSLDRVAMDTFLVGQMLGAAAEVANEAGQQDQAKQIVSWLQQSDEDDFVASGQLTAERLGIDDLPPAFEKTVDAMIRYASHALEGVA